MGIPRFNSAAVAAARSASLDSRVRWAPPARNASVGVNRGGAGLNTVMPAPLKEPKPLLPQPPEDIAVDTKLYVIYSLYSTGESITGEEDYNDEVKSVGMFTSTSLASQSNPMYIGQWSGVLVDQDLPLAVDGYNPLLEVILGQIDDRVLKE